MTFRNTRIPFIEFCRKWAGNVRRNCEGKCQKNEIFENIWNPAIIW
jgi:hypothetical protein